MDDLRRNMAKGGRAGKAFDIANQHVAMPKAGVAGSKRPNSNRMWRPYWPVSPANAERRS
jgi:hypothetical protein